MGSLVEYERQMNIDKMIHIAEKWFGKPYIYSGNSFIGVDCSGFVCAVLRSMGLVEQHEDLSVAMLWDKFQTQATLSPERGSLVFWFNNELKAVHIGICIDDKTSIQAARGNSALKVSEDTAIDEVILMANNINAMVDYVPINYRSDPARFVRLF